jgi:regulator of sirC expression with transglutaminase-like and TPR domain
MEIRELWSAHDEAQLDAFGQAIVLDDITGALLALAGASPEQAQKARESLEALARRLSGRVETTTATGLAHALAEVLSHELQLVPTDGVSPENAALHDVLARRTGQPAVIAAIWLEVARRAGIEAEAVGMPGHLFVRVGGASQGVVVDPADGRPVGEPDASRGTAAPDEKGQALRKVPIAELLARTLKHQVTAWALKNDLLEVYRSVSFACALHPEVPLVNLQRAALAEQLGAQDLADSIYREIVERFPGTDESHLAFQKLKESRKPVLLH